MIIDAYFGRIVGSPPGLPGGGITGVLPASGVGARICGSTLAGGHNTPSERASLSPKGSADCPVVAESFVPERPCSPVWAGAQFAAFWFAEGGAVEGGGVAGVGGACAKAVPAIATSHPERRSVWFKRMSSQRPTRWLVPEPCL